MICDQYLKLAKKIALKSLKIKKDNHIKKKNIYFDKKIKKEIKSSVDVKIEKYIINNLKKTNYNILSEETGLINLDPSNEYIWIVDPLDGTYNYVNNLGPSTISIALYKGTRPVFGVIGIFPEMKIVYGGKTIGSFQDHYKLKTSTKSNYNYSTLFTGFPSRFSFKKNEINSLNKICSKFAKVRMIGCASYSLFNVASGKGEYYYEDKIMLWDVAAGLAIIEGSGGKYRIKKLKNKYTLKVHATNNKLSILK